MLCLGEQSLDRVRNCYSLTCQSCSNSRVEKVPVGLRMVDLTNGIWGTSEKGGKFRLERRGSDFPPCLWGAGARRLPNIKLYRCSHP